MSRWIDAEHLRKWILARWEEIDPTSEKPFTAIQILNQIEYGEISIDIVRCKECKHYFYDELNDCKMCYIHEYGEIWEADDFCSYGEREGE